MISFEVRSGRDEAMNVAAALKILTRTTSLGGNHSLIEHRASVEGPATTAPESLLHVSIGLEHEADLVDDLNQALGRVVWPKYHRNREGTPPVVQTYAQNAPVETEGLQIAPCCRGGRNIRSLALTLDLNE